MRKYFILLMALFLVIAPIKSKAVTEEHEIVAKISKEDITLYARTIDGLFHDFKLNFKGTIYSRPFWLSSANKYAYAPKMIYEDINKDKRKELLIVLNKGYGSGVIIEEVHVFETEYNHYGEKLVDDPLSIIYKNVKTKLTTEKAEVIVGDKVSTIDTKSIDPAHLFNDISFGNSITYEVIDNHLVAFVGAQITPAMYIGGVKITYEYKDKIYQAKTIEFKPY